ncbi:MAG: ACT domain-containing protein [Ruminococcaceae bacterium]|nr:ACT domain-containing protein [Oscillospiraceae bacterium]
MLLEPLPQDFSVCRLEKEHPQLLDGDFIFFAKTDDEVSLVCETRLAPPDAEQAEHGWRALRVAGTLDFGMVGVLAGISGVLAAGKVPLFAVSTFNTDYILVKQADWPAALQALADAGYTLGGQDAPR